MLDPIKTRLRYSPESSQLIGENAAQQRLAYNAAVDYILAHPNISEFDLHKVLTNWRHTNPKFSDGYLRVQRPGLNAGRNAVIAFDKASIQALKECLKEVKLREITSQPKRRQQPKHPVRPGRSLDTEKLYRTRKKDTTLIIDDHEAIRLVSPTEIHAAGMSLHLAKSIPLDTNIKAIQIIERRSSKAKGRNRPLKVRNYKVHIIVELPDPEPKDPLESPVGLDTGTTNTLSLSTGEHLHQADTSNIENQFQALRKKQKRLKFRSRNWNRLQRQVKKLLRHKNNVITNWEQHTAKAIANSHSTIVVEDLKVKNMTASAKGTNEYPGKRLAQKTGLNRSLARTRPGSLQAALERQAEKNGTTFIKVPPQYTSQTCPLCGLTAKENRKSQAEFHCQRCHLSAHADTVGAINIGLRGMQALMLMLLTLAYSQEGKAANTRRRQGLPPLDASLTLVSGRPGLNLGPSVKGNRRGTSPQGRPKAFEPKLSI